jgi:ADP-heptose:LPS heptosyltransferase
MAFPQAHLAALVPAHCRVVLERNPDIDEILTYTKAKHRSDRFGLPALWELARVIGRLRRRRFDLAVSLRRSFSRSSAWLAYASGAAWRLGYPAPPSHPLRFFVNLGRGAGPTALHEVDACLELLTAIGIQPGGRRLTLVPNPEAQRRARHLLRAANPAGAAGTALIHISNRREASRWPLACFAQAADLIHEKLGLASVISWAPGDARNPLFPGDDGRAEEVAARMRTRPLLLPTPTLDDLIASVSLSHFVLSTDGGPMHIAAALDIPQVVLFGKTDARQWAPVSEKSAVLQRGGRVDQLSVGEVVEATVSVMSRWGRVVTGGDLRPSERP